MGAKKNIFEKLGLIESVDENDEVVNEILEEDNILSELESNIGKENFKDQEINEIDEFEVKLDKLDEKVLGQDEEINLRQDKLTNENIGEKLDELIGSYEQNRLLTIDDIYRNARLILDPKKSVFIVDILTKTLPENLPVDVKRETVKSLMDVSELKLDILLNDAYKRIDSLTTVMEETVDKSNEIISKNDKTIQDLEYRIEELRKINDERVEFQKNQNTLVEYEMQKIIGIVDFVKPKN